MLLRTRLGQRGVRDEHSDQATQWPVGTRGSTRGKEIKELNRDGNLICDWVLHRSTKAMHRRSRSRHSETFEGLHCGLERKSS